MAGSKRLPAAKRSGELGTSLGKLGLSGAESSSPKREIEINNDDNDHDDRHDG